MSPLPSSRFIDKQPLRVELLTADWRVEGDIHVMINHRPSDVLNDETRFLPMTDVVLHPRAGGEPEPLPFIALNKGSILLRREYKA